MAKSVLSAPHFQNEDAAFAYVEARLWPNGPVCPFCFATGGKIGAMNGKTTRQGLKKCYACKKPFTVRQSSIFESSHLPLRLWLQAIHLMCASKKGISTRQLQRMFQCSMKTAWHLTHRIRYAMDPGPVGPILGGAGKIVEADETFVTKSPKTRKRPGYQHKIAVLTLAERGGLIRSFKLKGSPNKYEIQTAIDDHVDPASRLVTDGAQYYKGVLVNHESVDHSAKEYVRGDVHVNSLEGFFSVFKRGLVGTYQQVSERHLPRYLAEFDFRQNTRERLGINDTQRADIALKATAGKRLTYRTTGSKTDLEPPF